MLKWRFAPLTTATVIPRWTNLWGVVGGKEIISMLSDSFWLKHHVYLKFVRWNNGPLGTYSRHFSLLLRWLTLIETSSAKLPQNIKWSIVFFEANPICQDTVIPAPLAPISSVRQRILSLPKSFRWLILTESCLLFFSDEPISSLDGNDQLTYSSKFSVNSNVGCNTSNF